MSSFNSLSQLHSVKISIIPKVNMNDNLAFVKCFALNKDIYNICFINIMWKI